jgi:hypothetical protein
MILFPNDVVSNKLKTIQLATNANLLLVTHAS